MINNPSDEKKGVNSGLKFLKVDSKSSHVLKCMYIKFHANRSRTEDLHKEHANQE